MITNKFTAAKKDQEITRLKSEVRRLETILALSEDKGEQHWKDWAEKLAAENAHMMAALAELGDPRAHSVAVLMGMYSNSQVLINQLQAYGYLAASKDMKETAREIGNPIVYDALMSLAGQMEDRARARIIRSS